MIDPKHNCIFIHVPKAAGTFIEHALLGDRGEYRVDLVSKGTKRNYTEVRVIDKRDGHVHMPIYTDADTVCQSGMKHWRHLLYIDHVDRYERYYKFAFVRNPWTRLYSLYNYMKTVKWGTNLYVKKNSFNRWIELLREYNNTSNLWKLLGFAPDQTANQFAFLRPVEKLDFVGKLENFESDFTYVMKQINMKNVGKIDFNKKINRTQQLKSPWEMYTDQSKEIVKTICKQDIDLWGYEFGK